MARINLLPWRQAERERKNKEFLALAGLIAAIAAIGVLMAMTFLNNALSNQQAANDHIKQENDRLDKVAEEISTLEQQREEMLSRLKIIQDLQGQRSIPVRVWDDIAKAIASQPLYLVSMKREEDVITLSGYADNPNTVSQLLRSLDASPWLSNSGVPNIQAEVRTASSPAPIKLERQPLPEDTYIQFTITTQVKPDVPKKEGEGAEQMGATPAEGVPAPTDGVVAPPPSTPPVASGQEVVPAVPPATETAVPPAAGVVAPTPQPEAVPPSAPAGNPTELQAVPPSEPAPVQPAGGQ